MSHWSYRVVRHRYENGEILYCVHEAYFGIEAKPLITTEPSKVVAGNIQDLREYLEGMLQALDKPVLNYETRQEVDDA